MILTIEVISIFICFIKLSFYDWHLDLTGIQLIWVGWMEYFLYSGALGSGIIVIEDALKGLIEVFFMIIFAILSNRKTEIIEVAAGRIDICIGYIVFLIIQVKKDQVF